MKNMFKAFGALAILGTLSALPLVAEMDNGVNFTTTFPFYVENVELPAGSYTARPDVNGQFMMIQSADGGHSMFTGYVPTASLKPAAQGLVTFHEYAGVDYMDTITVSGDTTGIEVLAGKTEKAAEKAAKSDNEQASVREVSLGTPHAGN